jgi:hypothetical protein
MKRLLSVLTFGLLGLSSAWAVQPKVEVRLEPAKVYLGASAHLRVEVRAPETTQIDMTNIARAITQLPGAHPAPVHQEIHEGEALYRMDVDLVRFELGDSGTVLADLFWEEKDEKGSLQVWLPGPEVIDVPHRPGDGEGHLRAARGVVLPLKKSPWKLLGLTGLGLLLLAGGWWLGKKARVREVSLEPVEPVFDRAMRLLGNLEQEGDQGDPRSFHYRLSEILREYLSGRFGLSGLSETSYELLDECRSALPDGLILQKLEPLLESMDLIKFGPEEADPASSPRHLLACTDLVRFTEPLPEAEVAAQKKSAGTGASTLREPAETSAEDSPLDTSDAGEGDTP